MNSPNGLSISSNKVLTGTAILEVGVEQDSRNLSLIMKTARALRKTLKNNNVGKELQKPLVSSFYS